jgi:hypothetical protein
MARRKSFRANRYVGRGPISFESAVVPVLCHRIWAAHTTPGPFPFLFDLEKFIQ